MTISGIKYFLKALSLTPIIYSDYMTDSINHTPYNKKSVGNVRMSAKYT